MKKYVNSCLLECANDYKDITIDMKSIFHDYQRDSGQMIQKTKEELQEMVSKSLEIQTDEIEIKESNDLDLSVDLDSAFVDAEHYEEEWVTRKKRVFWIIPWGEETVKLCDETHYIIIYVNELRKRLRNEVRNFFERLKESEIERYSNMVSEYSQELMKVFEEFAQAKQEEIKALQGKIESFDEEIKKLHQQDKELRLKLEKK